MRIIEKRFELINFVFVRANKAWWSIFEEEVNEIEGLNNGLITLRIFLQLYFFFSLSHMNLFICWHFSLRLRSLGTSYKKH